MQLGQLLSRLDAKLVGQPRAQPAEAGARLDGPSSRNRVPTRMGYPRRGRPGATVSPT
jgi:hypothetical protein